MGLQLPGELVSLLGMFGYSWPEADEEKLFEMGQVWLDFAGTLQSVVDDADKHGQEVWQRNVGQSIAAFQNRWTGGAAPLVNLRNGAQAATGVGVGLMTAAGVVLALKINVIVQLSTLAIEIAQAVATAVATFRSIIGRDPDLQDDHLDDPRSAHRPGDRSAARRLREGSGAPVVPPVRREVCGARSGTCSIPARACTATGYPVTGRDIPARHRSRDARCAVYPSRRCAASAPGTGARYPRVTTRASSGWTRTPGATSLHAAHRANPANNQWSRQANGYFRWQSSQSHPGDPNGRLFLEADGNIVPLNHPDFAELTHIMYEGP